MARASSAEPKYFDTPPDQGGSLMATTVDLRKVRDYLRYRTVSSRGERIAIWVLVPVVFIVILMFWGIPPLNIIPVWGPSMQPTLAVWSIPEPWAQFSFSGWVHYDPNKKPEVGSIVYFRIPNTRVFEVKRVAKINDEGELWVEPDNPGVSGEGSDNSEIYDWVEPSWVIGVIDMAFTPYRALRWFTPEGRFRNLIETSVRPCIVDCGLQLSDGRYFVSGASFWAVVDPRGSITRFAGEAQISEDRQSVLSVDRDKGKAYVVGVGMDLKSGPEVCIGEQLYGIVYVGGKFYVLGEDDNIWQMSPVSAKIIAPLPQGCNALSLRDGQIVAGWQDEVSPPTSSDDWEVVYVAR